MDPRTVLAAVALSLIGLAAGQTPSLPTTFTHTDYRVTVEIAEDLNAETENAVEVKLISPRGSGTSSVRFLEGTLKPRGVFQQRSVSVSANLQMDVGSTKIEWSTNGVDAVTVKRFTVSGDGRICYFYPTSALYVANTQSVGGVKTDSQSIAATECYDLQDFGLLSFTNAGTSSVSVYFAGVKYWQGPIAANYVYLKDVGHGNALAISSSPSSAKPSFFAAIKSVHLNPNTNKWAEDFDIVSDGSWTCTAGQNASGVGAHSYLASNNAAISAGQGAVKPTGAVGPYVDQGYKVQGTWYANEYHDFFWTPAVVVAYNDDNGWQGGPVDAKAIWSQRPTDAVVYCRGTLGLFISDIEPANAKIDYVGPVTITGRGFGLNDLDESLPTVTFIGESGTLAATVVNRDNSRVLTVTAPQTAGIASKTAYNVRIDTMGTAHGYTAGLQEAAVEKYGFTYNCGCDGAPGPAPNTCSCNANAVYSPLVPSIQ